MLKPALQLKLGQQLTMTPQLQQAIRLLQLPVLELQAQVLEALETNVMLETEEEEEERIDLASLDPETPQGESTTTDEDGATVEVEAVDEIVVEMEDPWSGSSGAPRTRMATLASRNLMKGESSGVSCLPASLVVLPGAMALTLIFSRPSWRARVVVSPTRASLLMP